MSETVKQQNTMQLKLIKGQFVPKDQDDLPMFKHCTGGSISITEEFLFKECIDLFEHHGIRIKLPPNKPRRQRR